MTGSGDTATLRMRGAPHAEPKIHGGDRKGETQQLKFGPMMSHFLHKLVLIPLLWDRKLGLCPKSLSRAQYQTSGTSLA